MKLIQFRNPSNFCLATEFAQKNVDVNGKYFKYAPWGGHTQSIVKEHRGHQCIRSGERNQPLVNEFDYQLKSSLFLSTLHFLRDNLLDSAMTARTRASETTGPTTCQPQERENQMMILSADNWIISSLCVLSLGQRTIPRGWWHGLIKSSFITPWKIPLLTIFINYITYWLHVGLTANLPLNWLPPS